MSEFGKEPISVSATEHPPSGRINMGVTDLAGAPPNIPVEGGAPGTEELLFMLFPERDDYIGVASRNAIRSFAQSIRKEEPAEAIKMGQWLEMIMMKLHPPTEVQEVVDHMKQEEV